ncbi:MAG TPA: methionyl-tRNA formyltransferase [Solirubrobacteraceae bacterium]|nr:methionyl-tRNA formyltransferase [Solirubrobacteraceae bacterium]
MPVVYLGTSPFAAAVLERVAADERTRPALVVTRPDSAQGRGRKLAPPPVASAARALGIDLLQPRSVNAPEAFERIAAAAAGGPVVVCAFGALLREPLLSGLELLNVHPSLLPRWRGAAPVERAIMAGDEQSGVCIMRVTAGLDAGPVALRASEPILPEDTYGTLAARLQELAAELLQTALTEPLEFAEQDEDGVTYADKIEAADRLLDGSRTAAELERTVRALTPHIGARVALADGTLLGVLAARAGAGGGDGLFADGDRLLLGSADGVLELLEVRPPGGRAMAAADYLRGRRAQGRL